MSLDNKIFRESFRATESEDSELIKAAKKLNMKKSEYIRYKLFEENKFISVPGVAENFNDDIYKRLNDLREKYIIIRFNNKDAFSSMKIMTEIQSLDNIIKNLKNIDDGKEIDFI